jgi:hypothetical protein
MSLSKSNSEAGPSYKRQKMAVDDVTQYTYDEFLELLDDDEVLSEEFDPRHPRIFTDRMLNCIEKYSSDDWSNTFQRWFPDTEELLVLKSFINRRCVSGGSGYYCVNHKIKKGFYNVEVKVLKYDEFISIIKDKKMYCKICKKNLFTAVTTDFDIEESVELKNN